MSIVLLSASGPAMAQPAPRPLQPRQGERQIERWDKDRRQTNTPAVPTLAAPRSAAAADDKPLFTLTSVVIDGAIALDPQQLSASYRDHLGRRVSQADLLAIAAAISDAYRNAGFHLSRAIVPPQSLESGRLRIRVIEGTIQDIVIAGDPAPAFGLKELLAPIAAESPASLRTLERQLLLANERPGLRIADTSLDEIGTASGRFRLTVKAQAWRLFTAIGVDNMGSAPVGPWQSSAGAALNSILVPGDSLAIAGSVTPGASRELRFARLSYDLPLGIDGLRVGVAASRSEVWPGDTRRWARTYSQTETYEARASFAPLLSQTQSLWLTGSLGVSDVAERNAYGPTFNDRIRLASISADYKLHALAGSWTYLSATFRRGLGLVDPAPDAADWLSRNGASPYFSLLNASLTHYQNLAKNWSLKLAAGGQIASGPLLTSQQYYLGGTSFGRGFESGWLGGDNAIAGSAELRYDRSLQLDFAKGYQLYGFVDGGVARSHAQPKDMIQGLASAGVGIRLFVNDDLQLGLAIARPLAYRSPTRWDRGTTILFSLTNALRLCPESSGLRCRS